MNTVDKEILLNDLIGYRNSMAEFDEEQVDYLVDLVNKDIEKEVI